MRRLEATRPAHVASRARVARPLGVVAGHTLVGLRARARDVIGGLVSAKGLREVGAVLDLMTACNKPVTECLPRAWRISWTPCCRTLPRTR